MKEWMTMLRKYASSKTNLPDWKSTMLYETTTWGQMYSPSLDLLALKFQPVYLYKNCDTHPSKCQRILPLILRKQNQVRR